MESKLLTTGQAAKICSVTPDTILKWIKKGRLPATRTAGGHYRIRPRDLNTEDIPQESPCLPPAARPYHYCWEYNNRGGTLTEECTDCIVYRTRAYRCFEVIKLAAEVGHARYFCRQSCDECEYFNQVHRSPINVLIISDNELLNASLRRDAEERRLKMEFANCEYTCSALVETFRPDYAVIDCSLGTNRSREFASNLLADPRIPFVRVILAARQGEYPQNCDKEIFARIKIPYSIGDIAACIDGVREGGRSPCEDEGNAG